MAKPVVFISHVHHEEPTASTLESVLTSALLGGLEIFNASNRRSLSPGDPWRETIVSALRRAASVLVVASPDSLQSPWVNFEAGGAWTAGTRVVPCCIKGLQPATLTAPLRDLQAVDLADPDGVRLLLKVLAEVAELDFPRSYDAEAGAQMLRESWEVDRTPSDNEQLIDWLAKAKRRPAKYTGSSEEGFFRLDLQDAMTPAEVNQLRGEGLQAGDSVRCWLEAEGLDHSTEYQCFAGGEVVDVIESLAKSESTLGFTKSELLFGRIKCLGQIKVYEWDMPPTLLEDEDRGVSYPAAWLVEHVAPAARAFEER